MDTKKDVIQQVETIDSELVDLSKPVGSIVENDCFVTESVTFGPCDDYEERTVNIGSLPNQARFLNVKVSLKDICRGREIAIGVILCDPGTKKVLGFKGKTFTVPGTSCGDVTIDGFCFVIPERTICNPRKVTIKVTSHYTKLHSNPNCP